MKPNLKALTARRKLVALNKKRFEVISRLTTNPYETIYQYDVYDNDSKQKICSVSSMEEAMSMVNAWNMGE